MHINYAYYNYLVYNGFPYLYRYNIFSYDKIKILSYLIRVKISTCVCMYIYISGTTASKSVMYIKISRNRHIQTDSNLIFFYVVIIRRPNNNQIINIELGLFHWFRYTFRVATNYLIVYNYVSIQRKSVGHFLC